MENHHATLIDIDGRGVLIAGPSGSGKTLLALHLLRRCHHASIKAQIIADDQVLLSAIDGQLIGTVPDSLRGKIEVHGYGIVSMNGEVDHAPIALHVMLTEAGHAVRMWDGKMYTYENVSVKSLGLIANQTEASANAVLAALGFPLWV